MDESLTIVLPVHDAERTLRNDVSRVLDAAADLTSDVRVLILDDASTDDTYDVASELAAQFRQVTATRKEHRGNLIEALRDIRSGIDSDVVIVHDGASRINPEQLRLIWTQQRMLGGLRADNGGVSFADLRRPSRNHPGLAEAHRRLLGFQRVKVDSTSDEGAPTPAAKPAMSRQDDAEDVKRSEGKGVGQIPQLPKPKFFGAITDFALGE